MSKNATLFGLYTSVIASATETKEGIHADSNSVRALLAFILANYPPPVGNEAMSRLFHEQMSSTKGWTKDSLTLDFLDSLEDHAVPVAVVRHLFAFDLVFYREFATLPEFVAFSTNSQDAILAA